MVHRTTETTAQAELATHKLHEARAFSGPPNEFWPLCLEALGDVAEARLALLMVQSGTDGQWKKLAVWPSDIVARGMVRALEGVLDGLAESCAEEGTAKQEVTFSRDTGSEATLVAVQLDISPSREACVAVFLLTDAEDQPVDEVLTRLQLVSDTPAIYLSRRAASLAQVDVERLAVILDTMALLNEKTRFMDAAMSLCNELASRHQCDRVSLGWAERGCIKLQAISHTEKFERKMDAVQSLEAAMEESLDQDEEVLHPPALDSTLISRDHESYASAQAVRFLCSLPIRVEGEAVAVVTLERNVEAFTEEELRVLHLTCDMGGRRLEVLKRLDRWFGARFARWLRSNLAKLIGVEHTWWKLLGLTVTIALAVLIFGKATYRVEAPFAVKTDDLAYVPAPFEGYIEQVRVKAGDKVKVGDTLLVFDTRDLHLEEAAATSSMVRYIREAEKARAAKNPAEMQIADAMADQARAQLDLVKLRLEQSTMKAPLPGVVIEGDLEELIGSPVKRGDILFKIAKLESLYVELAVEEEDVHEIESDQTGEVAFASRPELKFPVLVERLDPVAEVKENGNTFNVRASFDGFIEEWWRPGMSGIAKVNTKKRNLFWIFTHKTVDFLRMWLWW